MFCDQALARRVEAAERDMIASACEHVRRRLPDVYTAEVGGGLATYTEPDSPLNKVVGLGFAPLDENAWAAVEAEHARRGAAVQVELCTLGDPAIGAFLTRRGYTMVAVENVSARAFAGLAAQPPRADLTIEVCPADAIDRWVEVTVTGFGSPDPGLPPFEHFDRDVVGRVVRDFASARGVVMFLVRRAGEVAGAGSLRIDGSVAQLCGASTLPAHRRRGVQSALLAHRLALAARQGCELVVVTTQPGSKSQHNVQRHGFALLYSRIVLRRELG